MAKSRLSEAHIYIKSYNFIMLWLGIAFALCDVQSTMSEYRIWRDVQAEYFNVLWNGKR